MKKLFFGSTLPFLLLAENTGDNMGESCADIDNFSKPGKTIAEKANAELAEEREKAQVAETKNQIAKDKYKQDSEKIVLRKTRAEENAQITQEQNRICCGSAKTTNCHTSKGGKRYPKQFTLILCWCGCVIMLICRINRYGGR